MKICLLSGIFTLLLILYTTLFPFDFVLPDLLTPQEVVSQFDLELLKADILADIPPNILLFLPFGFCLACLSGYNRLHRATIALATLSAGLAVSILVEFLQVYLLRSPQLGDIIANGIGALLGFCLFQMWDKSYRLYTGKLLNTIKQHLSARTMLAGMAGYFALILFLSLSLQTSSRLDVWDPAYPLLVGNEKTGDRPWEGQISELFIASKALSERSVSQILSGENRLTVVEDALIGYYHFDDQGNFSDEMGNLPGFSWQSEGDNPQSNPVEIHLDGQNWLMTASPVNQLVEKIQDSSQFSLGAIITSAHPDQTGPARIISLSSDPLHRNFTLGQDGSDLIFRLRNEFTGDNGMNPELSITNVFVDVQPHHIIVTYNGSILRIFIDRVQNSFAYSFTPQVLLFWIVAPRNVSRIRLNSFSMPVYNTLYIGLFLPVIVIFVMCVKKIYRPSENRDLVC